MDGTVDSFRAEEAYNWHDDVMEITRRIVHETDEARLSNIANHFEVDMSEIRAFLEMKQQQQRKPQTNADRIRQMSDEDLARWIANDLIEPGYYDGDQGYKLWLDWLRREVAE